MMTSTLPTCDEEVRQLAQEFIEHILVRNTDGGVTDVELSLDDINTLLEQRHSPLIPEEQRRILLGLAKRGIQASPTFETEVRRSYLQIEKSLRAKASQRRKERLAALSPYEKLFERACNAERYPTEATLVAKTYLDGRILPLEDVFHVVDLLMVAADHGNAEAAWLLAETTVPMMFRGVLIQQPLMASRHQRDSYRQQAAQWRHPAVIEAAMDADATDDFESERLVQLHETFEADEECRPMEDTSPQAIKDAEIGDPHDQLYLASRLIDQRKHIGVNYPELLIKDKSLQDRCKQLARQAESWLRKSSRQLPMARTQLALNFAEAGSTERYDLLRAAAFPEADYGDPLALSPLACEFLMNRASGYYNPIEGEYCLRTHLEFSQQADCEFLLDDGDAAICLADWLLAQTNCPEEKRAEACDLYRRVVDSELKFMESDHINEEVVRQHRTAHAYAALCAGLMLLRGWGCNRDERTARSYIYYAREGFRNNDRDQRAAEYADLVWELRFCRSDQQGIAEKLLRISVETGFRPDPFCPLEADDIRLLTGISYDNPNELRSFSERMDYPIKPFGRFPLWLQVIEGFVCVLQHRQPLSQDRLRTLWPNEKEESMVECYAWSHLIQTTSGSTTKRIALLERVQELSRTMLRDKSRFLVSFQESALAEWLADKASTHLSVLHKVAKQEEAKKERDELISFLSHTLVNATSGGAAEIQRIAGKLAKMESGSDLSSITERLAAETCRMGMVESLVNVFKLYSSDPAALRTMWTQDQAGNFSALQVAALAIRQALLRFVFSTQHERDFWRLLPHCDYSALASDFMTRVAGLDMNRVDDVHQFLDWLERNIPFLQLTVVGLKGLHLTQGGARAIVIFALVGEFLANALKYCAANAQIRLSLQADESCFQIECGNAVAPGVNPPTLGGNTGLGFVRRVCELVDAKFSQSLHQDMFILSARLPIQ